MALCDRCGGEGIVEVDLSDTRGSCDAACPRCNGSGNDAQLRKMTAADRLQQAKQLIELAAVAVNKALDALR